MNTFIEIATIVSLGLMIGTEFAMSAFINPILWKLEEPARSEMVRLFAKKLGTAMPYWYSLNLILIIAEAIILRGHTGVRLLVIAIAIWVAVIVQTLMFLVPINNRLASRDATMSPDQAHSQHKRWDALHRARVVALTASMVLFLLAVNP